MKKKKFLAMMLLFLICFMNFTNVINALEITSAKLENGASCAGDLQFKFGSTWGDIRGNLIYYVHNGVRYPAYCISSASTPGVDEKGSYTVSIPHLLDDVRLWRVIINGYPYQSPSQLGVNTAEQAYMLTKQAIYSVMFDRNVRELYRGKTAIGNVMVNKIEELTNIGRYGSQTPQVSNLSSTKVGGLVEFGNYYYQEFSVSSAVNISEYKITGTNNMPTGAYIADTSGNQKSTFAGSERYRLMIPKSSLGVDIDNVLISLQGKCKTYPVFYGATPVSGWQNYAVVFDPYGDDTATARLSAKTNTARIIVNKTDDETGEPIPNTTFQLLKADGTVIANATTNSNGVCEFTNLYQADYIVKEISSNEKYILNTEEQKFFLNYDETKTLNITNEHKKGNVKIVKVDKDNHNIALGGVTFDLYSNEFKKVVGTYTTDSNGEITISNLRIGDFSLIEKTTNKWYNLAEDTNISVEWNITKNQTVENELKKGQVKVVKVDKDNNEVKLAGVKFNVLNEDNKVLETIITDSNGEALTSRYPVRDYDKLKLQECETLNNYVLNKEVKTIELKEEQILNITFENELKKGQVKVIKVDKDNNEIRLAGVKFNIEDEDGNLVDTIVTNEKGEATSKRLRIDKKYKVYEVETLSNYVLNDEVQTITLEQDKIKDITFKNELKKGQVKVIKVDKDNNEVKLAGVKFNIEDEDGNIVDTIVTNATGEATSKRLRIDKKYKVYEVETLTNYVLSDEVQTITLEQDKIKDITFENEKIKGYIQITKTSSEYNQYSKLDKGSPLANVIFEVYDSQDNLVDTITTDENGKAVTKELLKGIYKIKEISSAKYYLLNENIYEAEIEKHQEIVNVDITNDNVNIDIDIEKRGFIETQSNDDIYYNFKNIKNKSNVPLDNFTWSDKLPTDAVRINRLYTGTWNEELEYSVYYKTNKSEDYILFKENLNTQIIYKLDFKKLELESDEYVTDYEFRFGTVKAGFQEVESPILYCDILDGLGNGYVFNNKTKVTGNYFEVEVEDTDNWTTITYFKEININKILPKTRLLKVKKLSFGIVFAHYFKYSKCEYTFFNSS